MPRLWRQMLFMMLSLAGCASHTPSFSGIARVESYRDGLNIYFDPLVGASAFSITRAGESEPKKRYSIVNGRIVPVGSRDGFHPFAPRHFFLRPGDKAGTFAMFGGCSYEIETDQIGLYLHTECEPGDTDPNTYTYDFRPNSNP